MSNPFMNPTFHRVIKPYKGTPRASLDDSAIAEFFARCRARGTSVIATPKIDGIRCIKQNGYALTSSLKQLPNEYISHWIELHAPNGYDGELIVPNGTFQDTVSACMSVGGTPDFIWQVFDNAEQSDWPYEQRIANLVAFGHIQLVPHNKLHTYDSFVEYESAALVAGYEGVCLRPADSPYKHGRSTWAEGYLIAVKRFVDSEATVIGMVPAYKNDNPSKLNEQGLAIRSSAQANLVQLDTLGALVVQHPTFGQFEIGTGFTDAERRRIWSLGTALMGASVTFKYQPHGMKDKPRLPVYKGFRSKTELLS